jgi:hypothetical protein
METAAKLTLCPDPRRLFQARPTTRAAKPGIDALAGIRALFRDDVRPVPQHGGFAVVIGVSRYGDGLPAWPRAERDAAAMHALLVERLGFRAARVIELRNPTRAELDGVFGRPGNPKGLLSERLKDAGGGPLVVYVSGLGAIAGDDSEAYLLPADAAAKRERSTGYALETLYQNLARMGGGPITVVLEADFSTDPGGPVVSPNAPERRHAVLPRLAVRGMTVMTAAERDQRPLEDPETGLSLFTRQFIAGLSGHADLPPVGNGDGTVDAAEAFVYAASQTAFAARKLSGVLQRPMISQGKPGAVNRIGALDR